MSSEHSSGAVRPNLAMFPFQLVDIRLFEVEVKRRDSNGKEVKSKPITIGLAPGNKLPDGEEFSILLVFDATLPPDDEPACYIHLAIEGEFKTVVDISTIKAEVVEQFKSNDAIVLFWPYLRESLHDLANRMRLSIPPLPIIDPRALIDAASKATEEIPQTT